MSTWTTQRLRSKQIVAGPNMDMRFISMPVHKLLDQGALANTGLTPEQDYFAPGRPDPGQ